MKKEIKGKFNITTSHCIDMITLITYILCFRLDKKSNLGILEIVQIFEESSLHLYRISLALWTNTVTFKKAKDVPDCLLYKDKYASDIAITTLSEINKIVDSMDDAIQKNIKVNNNYYVIIIKLKQNVLYH